MLGSEKRNPQADEAQAVPDGPRAFPMPEARSRLGVGPTKMADLVREGELQTFLIGRCRYITAEELQGFINRQIDLARKESIAERAKKVSAATKASLRSRANLKAR